MAITAETKKIVVIKSYGGAAKGDYTNTYDVNFDGELDAPALVTVAKELGKMEQRFTSAAVFFKSARIQYATGKNAAGVKEKPQNVPLGFYGSAPMHEALKDAAGTMLGADVNKVLPPELVVAVNFSAGRSGVGVHTYRHAINQNNWSGDGSGVTLTDAMIQAMNQVFSNYMQTVNAGAPLVMVSGKGANQIASSVTAIAVAGPRNRQLENRRTGKKGALDTSNLDEDEAAQEIEQAIEVLQAVEAGRHTAHGANLFTSQTILSAVATLGGVISLIKASRDAGDYGNQVGPI